MSQFHIDFAKITDIPEMLALEKICFTSDLISKRQMRSLIQKSSADVFVVQQDQELIADAIVLYRKRSLSARLYSIAVNPLHQGKQVAQALLAFAEEKAVARQCMQMKLEVSIENERAIRFYERNQYQVFDKIENFYEDGKAAFRMRKKLI